MYQGPKAIDLLYERRDILASCGDKILISDCSTRKGYILATRLYKVASTRVIPPLDKGNPRPTGGPFTPGLYGL